MNNNNNNNNNIIIIIIITITIIILTLGGSTRGLRNDNYYSSGFVLRVVADIRFCHFKEQRVPVFRAEKMFQFNTRPSNFVENLAVDQLVKNASPLTQVVGSLSFPNEYPTRSCTEPIESSPSFPIQLFRITFQSRAVSTHLTLSLLMPHIYIWSS
jgi:hypothetical protein